MLSPSDGRRSDGRARAATAPTCTAPACLEPAVATLDGRTVCLVHALAGIGAPLAAEPPSAPLPRPSSRTCERPTTDPNARHGAAPARGGATS